MVGPGLFHINFWGAILQRVKRQGQGDKHTECWSHWCDLHSNFIIPHSFFFISLGWSLCGATSQRLTALPRPPASALQRADIL